MKPYRRRVRPQFILLCILLALVLINASILTVRLLQARFAGPEAEGVVVPDYVEAAFLPVNP